MFIYLLHKSAEHLLTASVSVHGPVLQGPGFLNKQT